MNDTAPIDWKRNLYIAWLGCFFTGAAFSLVMPFLSLYVEQLGIQGHENVESVVGRGFSITFLFSAIASPFWGRLADRKGRKLMLLRSALGMAIVMALMGLVQNIWQFLLLRAALGILGGFVPNANALIATQVPAIVAAGPWERCPPAQWAALCSARYWAVIWRIPLACGRSFYHCRGLVHLFSDYVLSHPGTH